MEQQWDKIKYKPSKALAAIVGDKAMSRVDVVKKIWDYIKKNNLQDKKNRRMINADAKLKVVFGGKGQISMFELAKILNKHLIKETKTKKQNTMSNLIDEKIAQLEAKHKQEMEQLKAELLASQKPQFEIGKWYKWYHNSHSFGILKYNGINEFGDNCQISIAFQYSYDSFYPSFEPSSNYCSIKDIKTPATEKEVEKYFIKYANRLGYNDGVIVNRKNLSGWAHMGKDKINCNRNKVFWFDYFGTELFELGGIVIYEDGVWAEIVKDEPIIINGYEVKREDIDIKIGCKTIRRKFLQDTKDVMENNDFETFSFDGHNITLEMLDKILNLK